MKIGTWFLLAICGLVILAIINSAAQAQNINWWALEAGGWILSCVAIRLICLKKGWMK